MPIAAHAPSIVPAGAAAAIATGRAGKDASRLRMQPKYGASWGLRPSAAQAACTRFISAACACDIVGAVAAQAATEPPMARIVNTRFMSLSPTEMSSAERPCLYWGRAGLKDSFRDRVGCPRPGNSGLD